MSTRKRSAATSGSTPAASKQPRVGVDDGATPATCARSHGRVVLNVGGQRFESSRSTLEGSSSYFQALLARWDEDADEPLFIDCDADAFGVLLSHMRIASNVILREENDELCARVLLLAEYLGMEGLLAKVKAKAYKNLHPEAEAAEDPVAAFDAEVGSLQEAIDNKVLPARFFHPAPPQPPEPPDRVVKNLIPAPPGHTALFADDFLGEGKAFDRVGNETDAFEVRDVLSFAVVELRDGTTRVEAIVQRSMASTSIDDEVFIHPNAAHPQLQNHLQFASEVRADNGQPWNHHLILPPASATSMRPVAPGTIRGVWAKPAITRADQGKQLTVTASGAIIVGDEVRAVTWGDRNIPQVKDATIDIVMPGYRSNFRCTGIAHLLEWHQVPYLTGAANQVTRDIIFAEMDRVCNGVATAKFYIADSLGGKSNDFHSNRVVDVTKVRMPNGMEFSHTVAGTPRSAG